jgi:hypothetical protein
VTPRPDSVVPRPPPPRVPAGRHGVAVGAVLLALVAAIAAAGIREVAPRRVVATGQFVDVPTTSARPGPDAGGSGGPTRPAPSPGPTGTPRPRRPAPPTPPRGYVLQHEPGAYWLCVPTGWTEGSHQSGSREWWGGYRPDLDDLLFVTARVARTAAATAMDALIAHERARRHGSDLVFYHRVQLAARPPLPGSLSTADLEFTDRSWSGGAQTWHYHTMIRAIMLPEHRVVTVEFSILHDIYQDEGSTEQDWQRALPTARKILGTIRPDADPDGLTR